MSGSDYNDAIMKVLVTGSTGFLGANLVEALSAAGHEVHAMHRANSRLDALKELAYVPVVGDVLDPDSLTPALEGMDWLFHVAAVADYWRQRGTAQLYRVNVGGTRNVLLAALNAGVRRVVFTSSVAALGLPQNGSTAPLDESATFNLPAERFPYGHSKYLAENVAREFVARGLQVSTVNPTVVLGPKDLNLISGSIIREVLRFHTPFFPPGGTNYVDVADVVAGHIAAAERGRAGERYILAGHNLTHRQALTTVAEIVGVSPPRWPLPRTMMEPLSTAIDWFNRAWPGPPLIDGNQVRLLKHTVFFDGSKARRDLNLKPSIPFRDSVARTFRWYRDNGYL
jgi:dihydroflavonol-4-reductase